MNRSRNDGPAVSFDEMIQADRKRRKHEELANMMLGSGRRRSVPNVAMHQRPGAGASLASRVGINKQRSFSSNPKPNIDGQWTHDLHGDHRSRIGRSRLAGGRNGRDLMASGLQRNAGMNGSTSQLNIRNLSGSAGQMSIKGKATPGPFVVIASNFAPGTSAADVEAAVGPVGGEILSCKLVSSYPTVMAEILFTDSGNAENVIATFNNQKADGRMLYVYLKQGGPSPIHNEPAASASVAQRPISIATSSPTPQAEPMQILGETQAEPSTYHERERQRDLQRDRGREREREPDRSYENGDIMEIEHDSRGNHRDEGRLNRDTQQSYPSSRGFAQDPRYEDGRYGFNEQYRQQPQAQGGFRRDYGGGGGRGYYNGTGYDRGHRY